MKRPVFYLCKTLYPKLLYFFLNAMFPLGGDKNMKELRILRGFRKQNEPLSTR